MSRLDRAIEIAVGAHSGQTDQQGDPYILHVMRVMLACPRGDTMIVGALHDVIEDTKWTLARIEAEGFGRTVVRALDSVTRREGEEYDAYIQRVADDEVAVAVKLADLRDNLARIGGLSVKGQSLGKRYEKAIRVLVAVC